MSNVNRCPCSSTSLLDFRRGVEESIIERLKSHSTRQRSALRGVLHGVVPLCPLGVEGVLGVFPALSSPVHPWTLDDSTPQSLVK